MIFLEDLVQTDMEKDDSYKQGYVDAVVDMMRVIEETMNENSQGNRQLFYGRLNPKVDVLVKSRAIGHQTPEWVSRTAENIKCAMCDKGVV